MKVVFRPGRIGEGVVMLDVMGWGHVRTNSSLLLLGRRLAVVEPGCRSSAEVIVREAMSLGLKLDDFRYLYVTHRHLDHLAGGPALLSFMRNAKVAGHRYAIATLKDPSRINAAARQVFGRYAEPADRVDDEERLMVVDEGDSAELGGGLELEVVSTPGHTSDHLSFYEKRNELMFTGDSAGILTGETLTVIPTAFPPSFKYKRYLRSIERMLEYKPKIVVFAHFGAVKGDDAYRILERSIEVLEDWRGLAEEAEDEDALARRLKDKYGANLSPFPIEVKEYIFSILAAGLRRGLAAGD